MFVDKKYVSIGMGHVRVRRHLGLGYLPFNPRWANLKENSEDHVKILLNAFFTIIL
jgi:hypothetical protein